MLCKNSRQDNVNVYTNSEPTNPTAPDDLVNKYKCAKQDAIEIKQEKKHSQNREKMLAQYKEDVKVDAMKAEFYLGSHSHWLWSQPPPDAAWLKQQREIARKEEAVAKKKASTGGKR